MGVRRQSYVFTIIDDGVESISALEEFPNKPQSIFTSGYGTANQAVRASTSMNQFITVEAMGSTPGLIATHTTWTPRGALNILIENTYFYNQPDGTWSEGLTGMASPFPISVQRQRSYNSFPRVYLDDTTNYDVTYYMGNSIIGNPDVFTASSYTYTTSS